MLKVDGYLTFSDKNYVLFFKRQSDDLSKSAGHVKNDNWSNYCHDDKAGQEFDGSSRTSCSFPGESINTAYNKFKIIEKSVGSYLRPDLPAKNETSKIDSGVVDYKWSGGEMLNITIKMENETVNYTFRQEPTGTNLVIANDSQY